MQWWKNLSVSKKLYLMIGMMGLLIIFELFSLIFGMRSLSAVRALVGGEGHWSKAQKDAVYALQRYAITHDESFYEKFHEYLKVPLGDHKARLELQKKDMNYNVVRLGLLAGKTHPDDIRPVVELIRNFHKVKYLIQAMDKWREGDKLINQLIKLGTRMHNEILNKKEVTPMLSEISEVNRQMTIVEDAFSNILGEASRWLEHLLMYTLALIVISIGGIVFLLSISFGRGIKRSLSELNFAAESVGNGDLNHRVTVNSKDEIGQLASSLNTMFKSLKQQIQDRESAEQSEAKIRSLADSMPQIVYVADSMGEMQFYNQRFWNYVGLSFQKPSQVDWKTYIHAEDLVHVRELLAISHKENKPFIAEYRLRGSDGTYRWFLGRTEPSFNQDGFVTQWYGTATDIHEQKQARQELQKAVKIRDEFMSIASHELKTPLTSLKLQVQIRKRYLDKGEFTRFIPEKIRTMSDDDETQLNRLVHLVDDMLDISRLTTGKLVIRQESCDLVGLVKELVHRFELQLQEAQCNVIINSPEKLLGKWDKYRIEQVIINLLTNAMKYGKGGPIHLNVFEERNEAIVTLKDHGLGILPQDLERIFGQFERAISPNEVSGLGLGLYIAQQIVKAHQGEIFVKSEYGKGSTFTVKLPIVV